MRCSFLKLHHILQKAFSWMSLLFFLVVWKERWFMRQQCTAVTHIHFGVELQRLNVPSPPVLQVYGTWTGSWTTPRVSFLTCETRRVHFFNCCHLVVKHSATESFFMFPISTLRSTLTFKTPAALWSTPHLKHLPGCALGISDSPRTEKRTKLGFCFIRVMRSPKNILAHTRGVSGTLWGTATAPWVSASACL